MSVKNLIFAAAGQVGGDYQISRSLRFNSADSAYLSRTPASAGNRKTWTWSGWVKRSGLTAFNTLFQANHSSTPWFVLGFANNDKIEVTQTAGSSASWETTALFRDVSAWYHVVLAVDTTSATSTMAGSATDRFRLYVNGTQYVISGGSVPSQNADLQVNNTVAHTIGGYGTTYSNQYLTEVHFIDGQALTPSSFGETDATTGVWKPIAYAGTYGTNGFYLDFSDNTSTTTLGYDAAGSNDWTPNNFSVTAGAGNDSLVDSPTQYGTDTGAGGEVRGNYCTGNPLNIKTNGTGVLKNGNLDCDDSSGGSSYSRFPGTIAVASGKWYFEATRTDANGIGNRIAFGVADSSTALGTGVYGGNPTNTGANANEWALTDRAVACNNTTYTNLNSTLSDVAQNDVIQICVDMDTKKIWFGKNNTFVGSPSAGTSETFSNLPASITPLAYTNEGDLSLNFGQRPFAYTAPSGFKALCTTNLPDPTILQGDDHFNTVLYTGTGSSLGVTGVGFQPDFVWIKSTVSSFDHAWYDAVRGVTEQLESNNTDAETTEATGLTAFNSDGFTIGASAQVNTATTYVAWNWKANGAGVSNTDGTITSTVSANTTAGISIVTYTGTGSAGATVGHGLGSVPSWMIVKRRTGSSADDWLHYHVSLGATKSLAFDTAVATISSTRWNDTAPSSTVLTIGNSTGVNASGSPYVAYCFAEVEGFSKFGSYTGNGSADGPFIYTNFRPAWVLFKRSDSTGTWVLYDARRNPSNIVNNEAYPALNSGFGTADRLDMLSNGFKMRNTISELNASGGTYIYAAFAEFPFRNSLAR